MLASLNPTLPRAGKRPLSLWAGLLCSVAIAVAPAAIAQTKPAPGAKPSPAPAPAAQPPATPAPKSPDEIKAEAARKGLLSGQAPDAVVLPPTRPPLPEIKDAEVAMVASYLKGSWISTAQGSGVAPQGVPPLRLHMARVDITGLDNAQYFELARADAPEVPFRQCILHVYKKGDTLRLRTFDFASPNQGQPIVGLWLAPEVFPPFAVGNLVVSADIPLTKQGDSYSGKSDGRIPTTSNNVWEIETSITLAKDTISFSDKGFDAAGKQLFGEGTPGSQRAPIAFRPLASTSKVQKTEAGLVIIDLVPPRSIDIPLKEGMSGVVNFTGWLLDGSLVGTTRQEGGKPQPFTLPGRMIAGWSQGLPGTPVGGKRRLIVPPALGFGDSGSRDGRVPPRSYLAFEIEVVHVEGVEIPKPEVFIPTLDAPKLPIPPGK